MEPLIIGEIMKGNFLDLHCINDCEVYANRSTIVIVVDKNWRDYLLGIEDSPYIDDEFDKCCLSEKNFLDLINI